ncbi:MAG: bi-domain-containing oxidoreductase [Acidobacteria bacterium]|nr:bi-domain-containing oxidoreductase [Acidobacteriota bacterium]
MKAVLQHYDSGAIEVTELPTPAMTAGTVTVATVASLISVGTERAMLTIAKKNLIGKALSRPDWVKQVVDKVKSDGILETYRQARARLDLPVPLGYSSAGVVKEVGPGVTGFAVGDRVACAGYPHAAHAEIVRVPKNLCVHIPVQVSFEDASYVMLGAIALNAVRLAEPQLGERVAVIGLGLLGLLAAQMLRAAGCRVIGIDISAEKLELARELGAMYAILPEHAVGAVADFTGKAGVDSALVFASTDSSQPLEQAADITRERGKVVVPGLVKLDLPRKTFFEKELRLIVPRAGGPGSGDPSYESRGADLPLPLVRWTEGRNLAAFVDLVADGRVRVSPLTTHRFPIHNALDAYRLLNGEVKMDRAPIGIVLTYPESVEPYESRIMRLKPRVAKAAGTDELGVGLIGAGLFTRGVLLPLLKNLKAIRLRGVAATSGASARHAAEKAGFEYCTTNYREILEDPSVDAVVITTRHDLHAQMAVEALQAGKHVFVEKPLAMNDQQLRTVLEAASQAHDRILMVGFNRRFAPATRRLIAEFGCGSSAIHCRVNAGAVSVGSWVQDPDEGGGRIVGEVCHFIDLIHGIAGGLTCSVAAAAMLEGGENPTEDTIAVVLQLDNGSIGSIVYAANGDKSFPRERIEVFSAGAVGLIENFRSYRITAGGKTRHYKRLAMDRGHVAELNAFFAGIRRGQSPVPIEDYAATTLATFRIREALSTRTTLSVESASLFLRGVEPVPETVCQ